MLVRDDGEHPGAELEPERVEESTEGRGSLGRGAFDPAQFEATVAHARVAVLGGEPQRGAAQLGPLGDPPGPFAVEPGLERAEVDLSQTDDDGDAQFGQPVEQIGGDGQRGRSGAGDEDHPDGGTPPGRRCGRQRHVVGPEAVGATAMRLRPESFAT